MQVGSRLSFLNQHWLWKKKHGMLIHTPRPDILVHSWKSSILKSRLNISTMMVAKRMYSSWMRLNCQPELWVRQHFPFQDFSWFSPFFSLHYFPISSVLNFLYSHSLTHSLSLFLSASSVPISSYLFLPGIDRMTDWREQIWSILSRISCMEVTM